MNNQTTPPTVTLERDLDAWLERELSEGTPSVPDFWDECCTSERLAHYLVSIGYVKKCHND